MSGTYEQLNAENIASRKSEVLLPYKEHIHKSSKYSSFAIMSDCTEKYTKFIKVINFCIECPGVFVLDAEINNNEDMELPIFSLIKMLAVVIFTINYYLIIVKHVLDA